MAKTVVQKVESSDPDVTIFKISGTLGFHENKVLAKFFDECSSREIHNLVIDFSDLGSLGGGCAKIIREAAESARVHIAISGASRTVLGFLQTGEQGAIHFAPDVEQAIAARTPLRPRGREPTRDSNRKTAAVRESARRRSPARAERRSALTRRTPMTSDRGGRSSRRAEQTASGSPSPSPGTARRSPPPMSDRDATRSRLKRKLVRYRALFSLNKEFGRIEDKSRLLDAFLLTTIAQVGVESAAFLELAGDEFVAACWKGFETADPEVAQRQGRRGGHGGVAPVGGDISARRFADHRRARGAGSRSGTFRTRPRFSSTAIFAGSCFSASRSAGRSTPTRGNF